MKDEKKTKRQLLSELVELRQRTTELEAREAEHKRTEEAAQWRLDRLQALREIDRAISSSLELGDRLDVLLDKLTDLPHIDGASVMVLEPATKELKTVAIRNLSEEFARTAEARLKEGLPRLVVEQEKPLAITDLMTNERVVYRDLFKREELASYTGLPLLAKGELIGVLGVYSRERHRWSQEQTDFLHTLTGQAAIAVHNAELYDQVLNRVQTIEAMREIDRTVLSGLTLKEVTEAIATTIGRLIPYDRASIAILEDGTFAIVASLANGQVAIPKEAKISAAETFLSEVVAGQQPVYRPDIASREHLYRYDKQLLDEGIASDLIIPLIARGKVLGTLNLCRYQRNGFDEKAISLAEELARQLAIAIENARLYEEAQKELAERKQAEEQLRCSLEETGRGHRMLLALSQAAQAVQRARTAEQVYSTIGDEIGGLGYQAVIFTLIDDRTHLTISHLTYEPALLRSAEKLTGLSPRNYRFLLVPGGIYESIMAEGETTFIEETVEAFAETLPEPVRPLAGRLTTLLGIERSIIAPLIVGGETHGLLVIAGAGLTEADVAPVTVLANQAAIAIENAQAYERLKTQNLETISALAAAVEMKDPYTSGHSQQVTELAIAIAEKMGLSDDEVETLRVAALLHDIGKIGIPDSVLNKPARLTSAEFVMVKTHSVIAAEIVGRIEALAHLVPIIRHHHERWDGTGYPDGLKGEDIPFLARILAVADGYDAMTSERPYRRAKTQEETLAELKAGAGTQWDPKVVGVFVEVCEEGALKH